MLKPESRVRNLIINFILVLSSVLASFFLVEYFLRNFYPKYEFAAERSNFTIDPIRVWSRLPSSYFDGHHPDTGEIHTVIHNNLALRQHRNFTDQQLENSLNLGFFGDSYVENVRIPVQNSFSEPLDYLLDRRLEDVNVLNFGVDAYGTDQSFLFYSQVSQTVPLDYVFYVFSVNDLRNIYENGLFNINEEGQLVNIPPRRSTWLKRRLGNYHTTYLLIDIVERMRNLFGASHPEEALSELGRRARFRSPRALAIEDQLEAGSMTRDLAWSIEVFRKLLQRWQQMVEENGGKFYVILLPRQGESNTWRIVGEGFSAIDLFQRFNENISDYNYLDIRFKNDGHWNEKGNWLAAVELYRFLETEMSLTPYSDDELFGGARSYFSAFPASWRPKIGTVVDTTSLSDREVIRREYLALDLELVP